MTQLELPLGPTRSRVLDNKHTLTPVPPSDGALAAAHTLALEHGIFERFDGFDHPVLMDFMNNR